MNQHKVELQVDGLNIVGEIFSPDIVGPHPALVLCHGIPSGNPKDPDDGGYHALARRYVGEGFIVMIFNFRGAGLSEGHFDILGWTRDLSAVLDYIYDYDGVDKTRLSVMGFSAGAKVSVYVAARDKRVSTLVSCCCPVRISFARDEQKIAELIEHQRQLSVSRGTLSPLTPQDLMKKFEHIAVLDCVDDISPRPLLIIHGDKDEVVDSAQAHELYDSAVEPKQLVMIEGAGHRLRLEHEAMQIATDWLKKANGLG
ncbi:MAG: alpha/beta fold hydrolase [Chloroflexi bacterium]|nr:alpha/beta fold hydrolase [Chloroflexota bacterium]MBT7080185.1 alpha/beta fold hydrolase [Chloroflexota bacterium]MBT7290131.1 alpha/beta fold hydrolase [Chloroflexota bacterium]